MRIDEIHRCLDCGHEVDSYNGLFHYDHDSGGFCPNCGGDSVKDVNVVVTGDGSMAQLMADGLCPKCHAELDGETICQVCNLEIY